MPNEDKDEVQKQLEEKSKKETGFFSNVSPIVIILIAVTLILAFVYGNFTRNQWIGIMLALVIIYFLLNSQNFGSHFLTTREAWLVLDNEVEYMQRNEHIPPTWRYEKQIPSTLPFIDGSQKEYFLPFKLYNERNISKLLVARINGMTRNVTMYEAPEGFRGTERPTIRRILPEDFKMLKRLGLEKSLMGLFRK